MNYSETLEWMFNQLPMYQLIGAAAYKANLNKLRLDALQTYQWKVMCIDGQFAVLEGTPVRQVGAQKPTVREAIDAAILERQHAKTQV